MPDLALELDTWMRSQKRWVSAAEICERFRITERRLRFDQGKPGLLSTNCISSSQHGYKHVRNCTVEEFDEADRRDRKHNVSRYIVLRARRAQRRREMTLIPQPMEKLTGQTLLFA